jgi:hypothetical protein
MGERDKDDPDYLEAYARGGRVAQRKLGPAPRMSDTRFPTMKTGPAPRPRAAPRAPAPEETPAALSPSRVFPVRGDRGTGLDGGGGQDAVAVEDGSSYARATGEWD